MPCYHPLHGWRSRKPSKNGKYGVVFDSKIGYRDKPMTVPCGQCVGCRLERSRQWAVRCVHEAQLHDENCFITLTYSDDVLENGNYYIPDSENFSLRVDDFQKFMKRLRKKIGKVRFFHCGEYGSKTERPHYHACLFGYDFPDKKFFSENHGNILYTSKLLDEVWGLGHCFVGAVSFESAAYVARYIMKKITGDGAAAYYRGRLPEYITMSRRPGIAADWLKKYKSDVFPAAEVVVRGKKMRPPRYYENQYQLTDPSAFAKLKIERRAQASLKADDNDDKRLRVKLAVKEAAIVHLRRDKI
nr:MAG: replication initiator protein [Microvirus sp.]